MKSLDSHLKRSKIAKKLVIWMCGQGERRVFRLTLSLSVSSAFFKTLVEELVIQILGFFLCIQVYLYIQVYCEQSVSAKQPGGAEYPDCSGVFLHTMGSV